MALKFCFNLFLIKLQIRIQIIIIIIIIIIIRIGTPEVIQGNVCKLKRSSNAYHKDLKKPHNIKMII